VLSSRSVHILLSLLSLTDPKKCKTEVSNVLMSETVNAYRQSCLNLGILLTLYAAVSVMPST